MVKCKALLIGINYTGTSSALRGCINDVNNVLAYLRERFQAVNVVNLNPPSWASGRESEEGKAGCCGVGSRSRNFVSSDEQGQGLSARTLQMLENVDMATSTVDVLVLTDDQTGLHRPTKAHILAGFAWLVEDATAETRAFVSYSGHGSHQRDVNGDEEDGQDESLVPLDYQRVGCIIDDEVRRHLIDPLPEGAQLRCIFDCCHSSSVCDVKYNYQSEDALRGVKEPRVNSRVSETKCNVLAWSGCQDHDVSADAYIKGNYAGALTATFLELMRNPAEDKSYHAIYVKLSQEMKRRGYTQKPQLTAGRQIDLNGKFDLF
jgi:hypothetical protein